MCLIIHIPYTEKAIKFSCAEIANWYKRNRDGMGCMYDGVAYKCLGNEKDFVQFFYTHYLEARSLQSDIAFHTRMRTHGDIDVANCHPYPVENNGFLIHNGVMSRYGKHCNDKKSMSDTHWFIKETFEPLTRGNAHTNPTVKRLLEEHIGQSNKLVHMDYDGVLTIYNKESGVTWRGCWFSNTYAWELPDELKPKPYVSPQQQSFSGTEMEIWQPAPQWTKSYIHPVKPTPPGIRTARRGRIDTSKPGWSLQEEVLSGEYDRYLDSLQDKARMVETLTDSELVELFFDENYTTIAMPMGIFNKADAWRAVKNPQTRVKICEKFQQPVEDNREVF